MGLLRAFFRRRRLDQVMDDEVSYHIEQQAAEYIRAGMTAGEARRAAELRFGTVASVQERCRELNGVASIESIWQDLRFAARTFVAQPGFAIVLLATLALGIGANTAVFSVLRSTLLQPLPLPEPDRIAMVWENDRLRESSKERASYPDYVDLRDGSRHFEHLAAMQSMDATLTGQGEADRVRVSRVTASYFHVIGQQPVIGRFFGPGEDGVVLSQTLWLNKFGGSSDVIGKAVSLDGFSGTILGVLPREIDQLRPNGTEVWTSLENVRATQFRGQHNTGIMGRLRRGSTMEQAQAEVSAIMARLEKDHPDDNLGRGATVIPLHEELAGNMRPALRALTAAVVVLLLIACVNIANLLLARGSARRREMAVRVSLGAGQWRLTRQLLTESLALACIGGVLGIAVAWWGIRGLIALAPEDMPLIGRTELDLTTLAAALGVSLAAWLVFGLAPAVRTAAVPPAGALQESGRTTASRSSLKIRHTLVIAQIALAAVLVISSGLLIRSFWRLHHVNPGFEPQGAIALRIKLPETRYPFPKWPFREWPAVYGFQDRVRAAVQQLPGIEAASIAMAGPTRGSWTTRVTVAGRPPIPEGEQQEAELRTADPEYLKATRARLLRGRFFAAADDEHHPMVAVINESFLRRHFPGEDPLGQRILVFGMPREVIGVIGDMRYQGPGTPPTPAMYFPARQVPFPDMTLIVRAANDPVALARGLRQAVHAADPNVAPFHVATLEEDLREATARERFILTLLSGFAAIALILAAVGIYGVVAYSVGRRRTEIALRMALGARTRDVFSQVVGGTLFRTVIGVACGIVACIFARRLIQPLVFETSPRDMPTYAAVSLVILAVAFLGAAVPALRAARLNPSTTLREE